MVESVVPLQLTVLTVTGEPLIVAVKSVSETVEHNRGSLNVAVTTVLPPVAAIDWKVGAVVSTVMSRVSVGDVPPSSSTARNTTVWAPSAKAEVGVNDHVAMPVTPVDEKAPPSTLTWTSATVSDSRTPLSVAVPVYVGVLSTVVVSSAGVALTVMAGTVLLDVVAVPPVELPAGSVTPSAATVTETTLPAARLGVASASSTVL